MGLSYYSLFIRLSVAFCALHLVRFFFLVGGLWGYMAVAFEGNTLV